MRILLAAVGKLKERAERELVERYTERLATQGRKVAIGPLRVLELPESRAQTAELRRSDEAARLIAAVEGAETRIALDPGGEAYDSIAFARLLGSRRDLGCTTLALLIGGPDGHGAEALAKPSLQMSLGRVTLPHGLARVVVAEQLYRAATILAGHPYHRA